MQVHDAASDHHANGDQKKALAPRRCIHSETKRFRAALECRSIFRTHAMIAALKMLGLANQFNKNVFGVEKGILTR